MLPWQKTYISHRQATIFDIKMKTPLKKIKEKSQPNNQRNQQKKKMQSQNFPLFPWKKKKKKEKHGWIKKKKTLESGIGKWAVVNRLGAVRSIGESREHGGFGTFPPPAAVLPLRRLLKLASDAALRRGNTGTHVGGRRQESRTGEQLRQHPRKTEQGGQLLY